MIGSLAEGSTFGSRHNGKAQPQWADGMTIVQSNVEATDE